MTLANREPTLHIADAVPDGLLELDASRLHERLPGPTLLRLAGRRDDCLFLSVLLHGNETTGWEAARGLLDRYRDKPLPRGLLLFIGNIAAAHEGARHLDWQPDYNRIWAGAGGAHQRMVDELLAEVARWPLFAALDVHNNTGRNPHYACVTRVDPPSLQLATLFGRTVVHFTRPETVITRAMAAFCPSVTVECGRPGEAFGTRHALDYIDACLHLDHLPHGQVTPHDIDLFHTVAIMRIPDQRSIAFGDGPADIVLNHNLDEYNFRELPAGTAFGRLADAGDPVVTVSDETGADVSSDYFTVRAGELVTRLTLMPSMLTCDPRIVRQDCLGYIMRRQPLPDPAAT